MYMADKLLDPCYCALDHKDLLTGREEIPGSNFCFDLVRHAQPIMKAASTFAINWWYGCFFNPYNITGANAVSRESFGSLLQGKCFYCEQNLQGCVRRNFACWMPEDHLSVWWWKRPPKMQIVSTFHEKIVIHQTNATMHKSLFLVCQMSRNCLSTRILNCSICSSTKHV